MGRLNGTKLLDLGGGTGLELGYYFALNPGARVTGIDLPEQMLRVLRKKFSDRDLTVIPGSYFDVLLGRGCYDAAVSVESLHYFTKDEKIPLYQRVYAALASGGAFVLTDYFASDEAQEVAFRQELLRLRAEQGITDGEFYHYDTPLTVEHECQALREAGFERIEVIGHWGDGRPRWGRSSQSARPCKTSIPNGGDRARSPSFFVQAERAVELSCPLTVCRDFAVCHILFDNLSRFSEISLLFLLVCAIITLQLCNQR